MASKTFLPVTLLVDLKESVCGDGNLSSCQHCEIFLFLGWFGQLSLSLELWVRDFRDAFRSLGIQGSKIHLVIAEHSCDFFQILH